MEIVHQSELAMMSIYSPDGVSPRVYTLHWGVPIVQCIYIYVCDICIYIYIYRSTTIVTHKRIHT